MRGASSVAARTIMETASGLWFDFADPDPAAISVKDIAQALSNTCRFGGHCERFYSVAEHALLVRWLTIKAGHPDLALAALHHDSHEAYIGDIPTPLKRALGPIYREMVDAIDTAIGVALGLDVDSFAHPVVAEADELALRFEAAHLKRSQGIEGAWPWRELPELPAWFQPGTSSPRIAWEFLHADEEDRP